MLDQSDQTFAAKITQLERRLDEINQGLKELAEPVTQCPHCRSTNIWWSRRLGHYGDHVSQCSCRDCEHDSTFDEDNELISCTYEPPLSLDDLRALFLED